MLTVDVSKEEDKMDVVDLLDYIGGQNINFIKFDTNRT